MSFDDLHFYATYEDAVGRSCLKNQFSSLTSNEGNEASLRPPAQILIYTYTSVISLLLSMLRISIAIFQPFFIVFGAIIAVLMSLIIQWRSQQDSNNSVTFMYYLFSNKVINYSPEVTIAAIIVSIIFILLKSIFVSDSHDIPRKPEGSAIKAGQISSIQMRTDCDRCTCLEYESARNMVSNSPFVNVSYFCKLRMSPSLSLQGYTTEEKKPPLLRR